MIPAHKIAELKKSVDLQVVAAEYVPLKKSGAQYLALCPWHNERSPSCRVYRDHYYCYTCQAKGSCIDWIMRHEELSFAESVRFLAERNSISLEEKPISRIAVAYAKEQAEFCKWWWNQKSDMVMSQIYSDIEQEEWWLMSLSRILAWTRSLKPSDKFNLFIQQSTAAERDEWLAEIEDFKSWQSVTYKIVSLLAA